MSSTLKLTPGALRCFGATKCSQRSQIGHFCHCDFGAVQMSSLSLCPELLLSAVTEVAVCQFTGLRIWCQTLLCSLSLSLCHSLPLFKIAYQRPLAAASLQDRLLETAGCQGQFQLRDG